MLDYQESTIARYCRLRPETGSYEAPHYPPMDRVRNHPHRFGEWVTEQEWLDRLAQAKDAPDELQRYKPREIFDYDPERGTSRRLTVSHYGESDEAWRRYAYLFSDGSRQQPVIVDYWGRAPRPRPAVAAGTAVAAGV
jgi:hypothetical protein